MDFTMHPAEDRGVREVRRIVPVGNTATSMSTNEYALLRAFRSLLRRIRNQQEPIPKNEPHEEFNIPWSSTALRRAITISLFRLPERPAAAITHYDLLGETVEASCRKLGVSRRQFFRDRRVGLVELSGFFVDYSRYGLITSAPNDGELHLLREVDYTAATLRALVVGLLSVGSYNDALHHLELRYETAELPLSERAVAAAHYAEVAADIGRVTQAEAALQWIDKFCDLAQSPLNHETIARCELVKGYLEISHGSKQQRYSECLRLLDEIPSATRSRDSWILAVTAMHAKSLSHDHQGEWGEARKAAWQAMELVKSLTLSESPMGLLVQSNYAMRDARQYGHVELTSAALWKCLTIALERGYIPVVGDIAVQFMNLNMMCLRYEAALRWHRWISRLGGNRLTARTLNFLAVDKAHALTMLGHPRSALSTVAAEGDAGLAFLGAREYWRSDALRAAGETNAALELATTALDYAIAAQSAKGRARCKRVLAGCHLRLGNRRIATKMSAECMELSEWFVSPYDLMLSMNVARGLDPRYDERHRRLSELIDHSTASMLDAPSDDR
jgi:hypothetical protein